MVEIQGKPVIAGEKDHRKMMLAYDVHRDMYSGSSGCSDLSGRFAKNGAKLAVTPDNSVQVCRVDAQTDRAMQSVIQATRGYRISNGTLELLDEKGRSLAKLER